MSEPVPCTSPSCAHGLGHDFFHVYTCLLYRQRIVWWRCPRASLVPLLCVRVCWAGGRGGGGWMVRSDCGGRRTTPETVSVSSVRRIPGGSTSASATRSGNAPAAICPRFAAGACAPSTYSSPRITTTSPGYIHIASTCAGASSVTLRLSVSYVCVRACPCVLYVVCVIITLFVDMICIHMSSAWLRRVQCEPRRG